MQEVGHRRMQKKFLKNTSNISMVTVRALIPAGVSLKDKFDVEIELPPGERASLEA